MLEYSFVYLCVLISARYVIFALFIGIVCCLLLLCVWQLCMRWRFVIFIVVHYTHGNVSCAFITDVYVFGVS